MTKEIMEFSKPKKYKINKVALAMEEVFRYNRCTRDIKRKLRNDWRDLSELKNLKTGKRHA